jgi:hypothetical protein
MKLLQVSRIRWAMQWKNLTKGNAEKGLGSQTEVVAWEMDCDENQAPTTTK